MTCFSISRVLFLKKFLTPAGKIPTVSHNRYRYLPVLNELVKRLLDVITCCQVVAAQIVHAHARLEACFRRRESPGTGRAFPRVVVTLAATGVGVVFGFLVGERPVG